MDEDFPVFKKKTKQKNEEKNEQKKVEQINTRKTISKETMMSEMPDDVQKKEDLEKITNCIEFRWRILKFPNFEDEIIEISKKDANSERLFINQNNEWIAYKDIEKYDKYVVDNFYYYQQK